MKSSENIKVYQNSKKLVNDVYLTFSDLKDCGFKGQICRAAISIMNNIAKGSRGEVCSMLLVANDLDFINLKKFKSLKNQCLSVSKQLSVFKRYLESSIDQIFNF